VFRKKCTDVLLCHPFKHHFLNLSAGVHESGRDYLLYTPLYNKGWMSLLAKVSPKFRKKIYGYYNEKLNPDCVFSGGLDALWRFAGIAGINTRFVENFDQKMADKISSGRLTANVLVTVQDYMPKTVFAASDKGMVIVSDQISNQSKEAIQRVRSHCYDVGVEYSGVFDDSANADILSLSNVVFSPSRYCINGALDEGFSGDLYTIPYGVSNDFYIDCLSKIEKDEVVILARANSIRKGGHILIESMSRIGDALSNEIGKNIRVKVLGEFESSLGCLVADSDIPECVIIEDKNYAHSEVPDLFREADFFLMPALSEGMSLVCLEAMRAGLPIISSKYCGVDSLLDGEAGPVVDDTVEGLSEALMYLIKAERYWPDFSKKSFLKSKQYGWSVYESKVSEVFKVI